MEHCKKEIWNKTRNFLPVFVTQLYVYVLFSKHVILLLPNTKGNERLAKLTSEHTTYMHPYKMAFISNKQNQHESFLMKNRENHVVGEKGVRFNSN